MTDPRFLQIHFLASYTGALLNRDDAGLAKRLPFGAATRTRISSQCLKRHWRMADDPRGIHRLAKAKGVESKRSKEVIERRVTAGLRGSHADDIVDTVEKGFIIALYGKKGIDKKSRQALLLGVSEIEWLTENARRIVAEAKDVEAAQEAVDALFGTTNAKANLRELVAGNALAAGLESALFGRMVTSDPRANTDAAIHVAHAFTVHAEQPELDYFTVVDDLTGRSEDNEDGDSGAAGVFDTELTSGLYYGYVVVDVPLLVSNLTGVRRARWNAGDTDRSLAARVVENLVHLIATISPGAKRGSTAPYGFGEALLLEAGNRQPRTLANAFREPVSLREPDSTLASRTATRLHQELAEIDAMYGDGELRLLAAKPGFVFEGPKRLTLPELAKRAGQLVLDAGA